MRSRDAPENIRARTVPVDDRCHTEPYGSTVGGAASADGGTAAGAYGV